MLSCRKEIRKRIATTTKWKPEEKRAVSRSKKRLGKTKYEGSEQASRGCEMWRKVGGRFPFTSGLTRSEKAKEEETNCKAIYAVGTNMLIKFKQVHINLY